MIEFNFYDRTYVCPYCGKGQAFTTEDMNYNRCGYMISFDKRCRVENGFLPYDMTIYHLRCSNKSCQKITVVGYNEEQKKQWDLIPENVYKQYPDYIPQQIRDDYQEACLIIDKSPKASATLLRRCLQGMIRDFWKISKDKLYDAISELDGKVPASQWKAIDGLRKLGNIGAHMEKDVDLIIDIEPDEAKKLQRLIELLLDKWYVARHDEEELYSSINDTVDDKEEQKKK